MRAVWQGEIVAEAPVSEVIRIEGNWYFPPKRLNWQFFEDSEHETTSPWMGEAHYYDVIVNGSRNMFGAWYYEFPKVSAIERVGQDFSNYVAFWNGIEVVE
jgi:uncharacterized protein (DUF427 family)